MSNKYNNQDIDCSKHSWMRNKMFCVLVVHSSRCKGRRNYFILVIFVKKIIMGDFAQEYGMILFSKLTISALNMISNDLKICFVVASENERLFPFMN